jgi:beta-lactamase regulating signal transducer with metallopeptidase domain
VTTHIAGWLLTWLLHATVACALMLLAGEWLVRDARWRDLLWKTALVAPLLTSLAAAAAPGGPLGSGSLELAPVARRYLHLPLPAASATLQVTVQGAQTAIVRMDDPVARRLSGVVLLSVLGSAGLAGTRLLRRHRLFWRALRKRQGGNAWALGVAAETARRGSGRPIRLTVSPGIASAAALGRDEVCVSTHRFGALDLVERRAVVAHEVAHLQRRDPAWIAFADTLAAVLVVQPLVRIVAQRLRRDAEFLCDEVAVRHIGDRVAYVRALAALATPYDAGAGAAPALASDGSHVLQRAERILSPGSPGSAPRRMAFATAALLSAVLLTLLLLPPVRTGAELSAVRAEARIVPATADASTLTRIDVRLEGRFSPE